MDKLIEAEWGQLQTQRQQLTHDLQKLQLAYRTVDESTKGQAYHRQRRTLEAQLVKVYGQIQRAKEIVGMIWEINAFWDKSEKFEKEKIALGLGSDFLQLPPPLAAATGSAQRHTLVVITEDDDRKLTRAFKRLRKQAPYFERINREVNPRYKELGKEIIVSSSNTREALKFILWIFWKRFILGHPFPTLVQYCQGRAARIQQALTLLAFDYAGHKRAIRRAWKEAESKLRGHSRLEKDWACRDQARLACFLKAQPELVSEMLAVYAQRRPKENLSGLQAQCQCSGSTPAPQTPVQPRPKVKQIESGLAATETPKPQPSSWVLIYIPESRAAEFILPAQEPDRTRCLARHLRERQLVINPKLLLQKLEAIIRMPLTQRQRLKETRYAEPKGWKIIRIGDYRVLLGIHEKLSTIRFLIRHRRSAYDD